MRIITKLLSLSAISAVFLTGCASALGTGNSEFGCTGLPEGISCMSARKVYELTEQPGPVRADPRSEDEDGGESKRQADQNLIERHNQIRPDGTRSSAGSQGHILNASPVRNTPLPIRTQPKVMRIWVAPWESVDGDLHASGQIFSEIEARRWNVGTAETAAAPTLTPLQSIQKREP